MTTYVNLERQRPYASPTVTRPPQPRWCSIYAAHANTFSPLMRALLYLKVRLHTR